MQTKKLVSLGRSHKYYIGKKAEAINSISDFIDKQGNFSTICSCNKSLENYIKNIRKSIPEITKSKQNEHYHSKET